MRYLTATFLVLGLAAANVFGGEPDHDKPGVSVGGLGVHATLPSVKADVGGIRANAPAPRVDVRPELRVGGPSVRATVPGARADVRIGDRGWDRNGIGVPDFARHVNDHDNRWRYQQFGDDWFYWGPQNNWLYYRGDRWITYDPNVYVAPSTVIVQQPAAPYAVQAGGPYYEDQQGFYSIDAGGAKIYDASIVRR